MVLGLFPLVIGVGFLGWVFVWVTAYAVSVQLVAGFAAFFSHLLSSLIGLLELLVCAVFVLLIRQTYSQWQRTPV